MTAGRAAQIANEGTSPGDRARRRVAMALYGDLTFDSRVRREARSLADAGYDVTIVCLKLRATTDDLPSRVSVLVRGPSGTTVVPGSPKPFAAGRHLGRLRRLLDRVRWVAAYARGVRAWGRIAVEAAGPVDAWHAHDLAGLAAVVPRLRGSVPVVYDSHELFLGAGTATQLPALLRRLLGRYERSLVSRTAAVITVNDEVAAVLRRLYRPKRLAVVHNCPERWVPPRQPQQRIRAAAGIPLTAPVILYHGSLSADRGIEQLMEAILQPGLEEAHLVLMGYGDLRDRYVADAAAEPSGRVHVLDAVPPSQLLDWVVSADVGAMPVQATTMNLRLSSPNKLFECLSAGVPVVASDFPAVHRIVVDNPGGALGAVCDPASAPAIAAAIRSVLDPDPDARQALRERCRQAADERWNWEHESAILLAEYEKVLTRHA